nr:MAG TPA: hypothetical protein [Caudoviricetes sp.]
MNAGDFSSSKCPMLTTMLTIISQSDFVYRKC